MKEDWYVDPKTSQPVDFISFARTEGRFARHFNAEGKPDEFLEWAQQDRLENWHCLQELAGLRQVLAESVLRKNATNPER